ncbi:MAG: hypothetical protein A2474_00720 [Elusimicrobia bacterium RIFOXYC2_FULL_34_12]|nr:MAG: hypothetical protein A2474_00720 [Elusimicrobia bacterium RIFOXYC2_FULL_34_12]
MINNSFAELLKKQFFGNTLQDYLITLFLFIGLTLLLFIFKKILLKYVKRISLKTKNDFDDFFVGIFEHINFIFFVFIAFYISLKSININKTLDKVIALIFILTLTIKIVQILQLFLAYCIKKIYLKDETDTATKDTLNTIIKILSGVLWTGGIVFILDNIGINISAIVAGIGITGVAVALAAQAILGDLFSSFAIFIDKPFKVGDFVIIDDFLGTIEHIGIKTTHIRSLHGELLIFSNSDLTKSRIKNYKRMESRRIAFKIGVTYQTPSEKLKQIPQFITDIIKNIEKTKLDRVHFFSYGDFSLIYEIVYYIFSSDYNLYMDIQQKINLSIKEIFDKESIEFAYPTQTLFVVKQFK